MQALKKQKSNGLPKYLELQGKLLEELSIGKFNLGDKFYSEAQVSKNYNIALMTVRRSYELLEEQGFLRREQGSGTYVNKVPDRVMRQKIVQTCMVGIYLSSERTIDGVHHRVYLEALSLALRDCGMATAIIFDDPKAIPTESLDGLIYLGEYSENEIQIIRQVELPTVSLGASRLNFFPGVCQKKDFVYSTFMSFLHKGRRKIALLNFSGDPHFNDPYFIHLKKAIDDFGAGEYLEICGPLDNLQATVEECLSQDNRPDAIWFSRWSYTPGVMLALEKSGLWLGHDIGVFVGICPDFGLAKMPVYIHNEIEEQSKQVANMLAKMIKDPQYKGDIIEEEPIILNKEAF